MDYKLNDKEKEYVVKNYKKIVWEKYTKIANDIIKGKYGNGNERRKKVENAGYDYDLAQSIVNVMLLGVV